MNNYLDFSGSILIPLLGVVLGIYYKSTDRKQKAANEFVDEMQGIIKRGEKVDQEKLDSVIKRIAFKNRIKTPYLENRMAEMILLATSGDEDGDWRVTSSKLHASLLAMRYKSVNSYDYLEVISKIIVVVINYLLIGYLFINNPFNISSYILNIITFSLSFFNSIVLQESIRFIRSSRK